MRKLMGEARRLGVQVHVAQIADDPDLLGYYLADERLIVIRRGLTRAQTRSVLAHELGHVYYGHTCDSEANERQADAYAAQLLIDPRELAELEHVNDCHHHLAEEFGVTPHVIRAFQLHSLTRLRGVTYAHARMGIGQWQHRSLHA